MGSEVKQPFLIMNALQNLFSSNSRPSAARKLMDLHKTTGEEGRFVEKAIEHLVKKLKRRKLEELERAINNPGAASNCVTITRSLDGRVQIANRKSLPHVIYCRLWRWPDLRTPHELRPARWCRHPFSKRDKEVCINPFHYERVELTVSVPKKPCTRAWDQSDLPQAVVEANSSKMDTSESVPAACGYQTTTEYMVCDAQTANPCPATATTTQQGSTKVSYPDQTDWAMLAYYEMNSRIGEIFHCSQNDITVDGGTDPSNESGRFCLKRMTNVNRTFASEKVLKSIGKGITLRYAYGEVFLDNADYGSVYVQSWLGNWINNYNDPATVIKVPSQGTLKIFDLHKFCEIIKDRVRDGYESVYELTKMCTIRLSFIKGWGGEYQRQDITSTPCWLEIHLIAPLKWLDNILTKMPNTNFISSQS